MSSSPQKDSQDFVKHSKPIPIGTTHSRHRSASTSSSSDSSTSPSEPQTPLNNSTPPRTIPTNISPSTSPILSYFIGNSPTKTATFPFNRNFPVRPPVFEEDETDTEVPVATHARRASTAAAGRFGPQQSTPVMPDNRGSGLLRRLSLGNALAKPPNGMPTERIPSSHRPTTPPNTAVSPGANGAKMPAVSPRGTRSRRSATLSVDGGGKPRRAPSPMGERILKGHFDGFN